MRHSVEPALLPVLPKQLSLLHVVCTSGNFPAKVMLGKINTLIDKHRR